MTPVEKAIATYVAKCRDAECRSNKVTDRQVGSQDPVQIEYDGVLSEMAVAKKFNAYPDFTTEIRKGGYDLLIRGLRADVKSTRYDNVIMCIHKGKDPDACDIYVSTRINIEDNVEILGYIESAKAITDKNIGDLGHGPCYVIHVDKLNKF